MISTTKINTYNNLKTTVDIFNTNIIVIVAVMKTSSGSKSRYNKSNMYSNSSSHSNNGSTSRNNRNNGISNLNNNRSSENNK